MSTKTIAILSTAGAVALFILIVVMMGISASNREIELRNQAKAQQDANKTVMDNMWKILQQKANISEKYAEDWKQNYHMIMSDRYANESDNLLFRWIQEKNPEFSIALYTDLSDAVTAQRSEFTRVQKRLIDIKREHDNIRMKFPSNMFVGGRPELEIIIVTSDKTERMFSTGRENERDMELFKK